MATDEFADGMSNAPKRTFSPAELSALLSGAPFLEGLPPSTVADVAEACELVQLAGDEQLVRREVPSDSLYVIVHGGLRTVTVDPHGGRRVVQESYRGDSVGFMNLVPGVSVPVDVFALRDSVLLRLTRERFAALARIHPELLLRLAEGLARRALSLIGEQAAWTTWSRPGASAQNIALLLPDRDPLFATATSELAFAALERYRRVGRVTRRSLDAALGEGASSIAPTDSRNEQILRYLQEIEQGHELLLYQSDTTFLPWHERCLRQADRVLCVMRVDVAEHVRELRETLSRAFDREQPPQLDVALVHPADADVPSLRPEEWSWLPPHARIHHVRMGHHHDYERVARTILRAGTALVLSGGGARGIAHVGVLQALEDAQFPVDAIAGASMGSIVAAGYARGWTPRALLTMMRDLFSSRTALYDPTWPSKSLLAGRKLERVLQSNFGGLDIESLWLPFFCVSTNLSKAEPQVHDRGELWRAITASCSMPGIFPPRVSGRDHLVDGGVMNNLPIDVMADRFEGAIIASDVGPQGEGISERRPRGGRFRQFLHRRRHRPEEDRGLGIFEILTRSTLVGSRHKTLTSLASGKVSLYLPLPVGQFRTLEWSAWEELYAAGYEYARQQLASWEPPRARSAPTRQASEAAEAQVELEPSRL